MAYTKSLAQSGRGTVISIGTSGATPTFQVFGEIKGITQSGASWGTEDVTNMESGIDEEFQTTIRNNGEFSIMGNRVPSDAGQIEMNNAYQDGFLRPFKVQLAKNTLAGQLTSGDLITFNAIVMSSDIVIEYNKVITFTLKLKVSGGFTTTPGA